MSLAGPCANSETFTVAAVGLISWLRPMACGAGVVEIGRFDPTTCTKAGGLAHHKNCGFSSEKGMNAGEYTIKLTPRVAQKGRQ